MPVMIIGKVLCHSFWLPDCLTNVHKNDQLRSLHKIYNYLFKLNPTAVISEQSLLSH